MNSDRKRDSILILSLASVGVLWLYLRGAFAALPFEDAAILMRYVDHLAQGEGMVWNRGEAPIDGATDFLFVLCAAGLQFLGLSTESAVQALNTGSFIATVFLVFISWRRQGVSSFISTAAASILLFGPGYAYIEAYFATTFFAFWGTLLTFLGNELIKQPESKKMSYLFGITALLLGLSRPEGVFLSFFLVIALMYYLRKEQALPTLNTYLLILVGLGSLYLIWRYIYFGHLFPNPFYKKGGGYLYPASLLQSCIYVARLLLPLGIIFLLLFRPKSVRKEIIYACIPILGFTGIWMLLSDEMNYLMRFQYILLPMTLVSLGFLWKKAVHGHLAPNRRESLMLLLFGLSLVYYIWGFPTQAIHRDGRFTVAQVLQLYQDKGYTLATTEAGLLPFYSRWRSLDTWGLNDHTIAVEGVISQSYLSQFDPDMIMYDSFSSGQESFRGSIWSSYGDMIDTLNSYILAHEFELIAKFPDSQGKHAHHFFVKKNLKDAAAIRDSIRNTTYFWYEDGKQSPPVFP